MLNPTIDNLLNEIITPYPLFDAIRLKSEMINRILENSLFGVIRMDQVYDVICEVIIEDVENLVREIAERSD